MSDNMDIDFMCKALTLAQKGLGRVWPNPSVGCILVKDGEVIASARTSDGGRPHAEFLALQKAGADAKGSTAYVTLEPCRHETSTPSCARELVHAGVSRVVIGCLDPDPRTAGEGARLLRDAGVDVCIGLLEDECKYINIGFLNKINKKRPFVNLKTATSLDGHIAMMSGESQWITGEKARKHVHQMRAEYDAIITGVGTVLADDPQLTSRNGKAVVRAPVRIILDSVLQTPENASVLADNADVYIFHDPLASEEDKTRFSKLSHVHLVDILPYDLDAVLTYLATEIGLTRVMVEAGAKLFASFLSQGCFDQLSWYRAPLFLGKNTQNLTSMLDIEQLSQGLRLKRRNIMCLDEDLLEIYECTQ